MLKAIKRQLKIQSPSRVYRDEIGDNLALGIGVGFEETMKEVSSQMAAALPLGFDEMSTSRARYVAQSESIGMVEAFKSALAQMKVVLDDEEVGSFVDKTVTRAIYV